MATLSKFSKLKATHLNRLQELDGHLPQGTIHAGADAGAAGDKAACPALDLMMLKECLYNLFPVVHANYSVDISSIDEQLGSESLGSLNPHNFAVAMLCARKMKKYTIRRQTENQEWDISQSNQECKTS